VMAKLPISARFRCGGMNDEPMASGPDASALAASDTVIIVAYHLPIIITRTADGGYNVEWDDDRGLNRDGMNLPSQCIYIGCIDMEVTDEAEQESIERLLLENYSCVVLFLEPELKAAYYHGFCRGYLTPILHNQMHQHRGVDPFQEGEWRAYCTVNRLFAAKVMEVYSPGHMIWVHDYHLMLLPSCILRKLRSAKIGLFIHAPFPASDLWASVAVRTELLRSLLNADLLGFLLFEYTRNFLSCCKRMLGLEYEFHKGGYLGVEYEGRHVMLQVATFGISPPKLEARLAAMSHAASGRAAFHGHAHAPLAASTDCAAELGSAIAQVCSSGRVVVGGVDYLDRLKGVAPKMLAWEALLRDYPHYRNGHVLLQVCVGARNKIHIQEAGQVEAEITRIVERITAAYPGTVHFEVRSSLSPAARLQLWAGMGMLVGTQLREAVNVWPLEYVYSRHLRGLPAGVLVLSEFSGFARVLNGGLRVNPNSQKELVEALDTALRMAPAERLARGLKDLAHIQRCTLEEFANRFVTDLKATQTKREEDFVSVGFGLSSFRMVGMGAGFKPLDVVESLDKFQRSSHRALLLDWGGTLTPADAGLYDTRDSTDGHVVPQRVLNALQTLCADPKNHVMILSGLGKEKVLAAFGSVPNLSLAVEHGFTYRVQGGQWQQLVHGVDTSWRSVAASVMQRYCTVTHGAYVLSKGSSMAWNFVDSDPEFGVMQAKEVQFALQHVLSAFPVVVRTGKGYVEACLKDVNKGVMAERFVDLCQSGGARPLDFVLCIGDDSTDELMFGHLHQKLGKHARQLLTSTVGRKPSEANSYLNDHGEVLELLELLCTHGNHPPGSQPAAASSMRRMAAPVASGGMSASYQNLAALG